MVIPSMTMDATASIREVVYVPVKASMPAWKLNAPALAVPLNVPDPLCPLRSASRPGGRATEQVTPLGTEVPVPLKVEPE